MPKRLTFLVCCLLYSTAYATSVPDSSRASSRGWRQQYRVQATVGMPQLARSADAALANASENAPILAARPLKSAVPARDFPKDETRPSASLAHHDPNRPRTASANPDVNRTSAVQAAPSVVVPSQTFQVQTSVTPYLVDRAQPVEVETYTENSSSLAPVHSNGSETAAAAALEYKEVHMEDLTRWTGIAPYSEPLTVEMARAAQSDPRVLAFMDVIARGEVNDWGRNEESYKIIHGFKRIAKYGKYHPGIVHKGSSASGRYQFLKRTFNPMVGRYPSASLDFTPEGQDLAVILLMHERNILPYLKENDIRGAIVKAAPVWASLPYYEGHGNTSYYRNHGHNRSMMTFDQAIEHYENRLQHWLNDAQPNIWQPVEITNPLVLENLPVAWSATKSFQTKSANTAAKTLPSSTIQPNLAPTDQPPTNLAPNPNRRWKVSSH